MATEQHPRLLRSGLTGRVYVVTRYKELGDGRFESLEKFDVTDDFQALVGTLIGARAEGDEPR